MLTTERVCRKWSLEDLFGSSGLQWCPVCGSTSFTLTEGDSILCDECEARFRVRGTCGDEGCVVDCIPKEDGKYTIRKPLIAEDAKHSFWQVLKTCEGPLEEQLGAWCTHIREMFYLRQKSGPVGEELFYYNPWDVAETLARQKRDQDADPATQRAFVWAESKIIRAELDERDLIKGYYLREQCETIFDDGYWVHHCIPNDGEEPIRVE